MTEIPKLPDGWRPIDSAPKDRRIRVGHIFDPNSLKLDTIFPTFGQWDGDSFACNNGFVCIDRMLRFAPTHWLPEASA